LAQYSTNSKFTDDVVTVEFNEVETIVEGSFRMIVENPADKYKSMCYVRVRKVMLDDVGNEFYGAWSDTTRVSIGI
jgi:hypothetical protein